jgi:hypothetical protein
VLDQLRLAQHPDKTFIGRTRKGFDFLGFHFGPHGIQSGPPKHPCEQAPRKDAKPPPQPVAAVEAPRITDKMSKHSTSKPSPLSKITVTGVTPNRAVTQAVTMGISINAWQRHRAKITRLYEQGANHHRVGLYRQRWAQWVIISMTDYGISHRISLITQYLGTRMEMTDTRTNREGSFPLASMVHDCHSFIIKASA